MKGILLEFASEQAEKLALKDWGTTRKGFWIGENMSDEAQDIFNDYYDEILTNVENVVEIFVKESYILGGKAAMQMVSSHPSKEDYSINKFIKTHVK